MPEVKTIGGAVVLVIILAGLYLFYRYRKPNEEDKEAADAFLNKLSDAFVDIIQNIVAKIDVSKYLSMEELESDIFAKAYDAVWKFATEQVASAVSNKAISSLVSTLITRETVEELVTKLIAKGSLLEPAALAYAKNINAGNDEAEQFEREVSSKNLAYETCSLNIPDDYQMTETETPEEDINPPKEDGEEEYSDDDTSVESVPDDTPVDREQPTTDISEGIMKEE